MNKKIKITFFSLLIFAVGFNACERLIEYYKISNHKCTSCNTCVSVCGYGAISIDSVVHQQMEIDGTDTFYIDLPTTVKIDPNKCVACGECFKSCPSQAISLNTSEAGKGNGNGNGNN